MRGRDIPRRSLVQEDGESGMIFAIKAERRDSCGPRDRRNCGKSRRSRCWRGCSSQGINSTAWGQAMVWHRAGSSSPHFCVNASWFLPFRVSGFERPGRNHPSLGTRMRPTNQEKIAIGKIFCYSQFPRGWAWHLGLGG